MINFQNIDTLDTFENYKGIIAITFDPKINILAYPDKANGYVKLKNYEKNETILMNAHNSKIAHLSLSSDGKFLASASEKGTKIRIFFTGDGTFLHEFQVEKNTTDIFSIAFNMNNYISCSCSTGTIHIFSLKNAIDKYLTNLVDKYKYF
jgi:WD40 repeat protein